ncbi:MAG: sigma-70 family RNA polymerase sigma factor, partial [Butyricicoccus sp.]|nr:sigma-70 family RNA polymerase sigma factor [Butyricicoccus sp.]
MEDLQIITLYWARDERAISESANKYGGFCHRISYNILHSGDDAEECVNDTWLHAWNAMPPERPSLLSAFLGRIVRNLSISRWREKHAATRSGGAQLLLDELAECLPGGTETEAAFEARETARVIDRWLDAQKPDDRAFFVRRYWHGESVADLADEAGLTAQSLTKR